MGCLLFKLENCNHQVIILFFLKGGNENGYGKPHANLKVGNGSVIPKGACKSNSFSSDWLF